MKSETRFFGRKSYICFVALFVMACAMCVAPALATAADVTINVPGDQPTIAAAVEEIKTATVTEETNYTVRVAPGPYSDQVAVLQQENKNILIQATGPGVVLTNNITLSGDNRYYAPETFTLDGVKFNFPGGGSSVSCILTTSPQAHGYIHNITIKNCEFTGDANTVGMTVTYAGTGEVNGLTFENCTATNIHSLLQAQGTRYLTVTDCTVTNPTGGRGINVLANNTNIISGCTFDVMGGYALRFGNGAEQYAPLGPDDSVTVTDCYLSSGGTASDEGTFVIRGNAPKNITVNNSSLINKNDGFEFRNINVAHGDEFVLDFNDNYWGPRGCSPEVFTGLSNTQLDSIVSRYYARISFDGNGGTFSDGSAVIPAGTALVPTEANLADFVAIDIVDGMTAGYREATFPTPTWGSRAFLGFFTDATAGDQVSDPKWGRRIENLIGDSDLYAHWGEPELITVTFDPQNGSDVTTVGIEPGTQVSPLDPQPTRTGYTFDGWWTDPTGGTKWDFTTPINESMTLYAHWTKDTVPPTPVTPSTDTTQTGDTTGGGGNAKTGDTADLVGPFVLMAVTLVAAVIAFREYLRTRKAKERLEN